MNARNVILLLNRPKVLGQLRHLTNSVGAIMATHGVVSDTNWQIWSGLAIALFAFAGSIMAQEKQA